MTTMLLLGLAAGMIAAGSTCWWVASRFIPQPPPPSSRRRATLADPDRLRAHVEFLTEQPRHHRAAARLAEIVGYLSGELGGAGGRVSRQEYAIPACKGRRANVVARFGAPHSNPATPPALVVVGAHYDSCGDTPGADDNASGVAVLLEAARLLGAGEGELVAAGVQVELVAYFGEEPPFFGTPDMGSFVHAQGLRRRDVEILGVLVLEMVGYYSDERGSQSYPPGLSPLLRARFGSRGDFIGVVGQYGQEAFVAAVHSAMQSIDGLPVHSIAAPRSLPGVGLSDHINYWEHGDRAVMLTDTAFYRNPNYHKSTDTADTLDYARMAIVAEQVAAAVHALADGAAGPRRAPAARTPGRKGGPPRRRRPGKHSRLGWGV